MEIRRTMTMNWDALGDLNDNDDLFFDAQRLSIVDSSTSDEDFDDSRTSFSSAMDSSDFSDFRTGEYDMWMVAPESITDRRMRLLRDMGLGSSKDLSVFGSSNGAHLTQIVSKRTVIPPPANVCSHEVLSRSRSHGSIVHMRKDEMIGSVPKQRLTRTFSGFQKPLVGLSSPIKGQKNTIFVAKDNTNIDNDETKPKSEKECILLIKNLDNGKEFIVKECNNEGNWNKLSDVETGNQITMEEFEKKVGHSTKVKELMKKVVNDVENVSVDRKLTPDNSFHKSFRKSKKKGAALFKNIKLGSIVNNPQSISDQKSPSQWVKTRVHGKPYKEFTALHMSQEIQGHKGSIWVMKFTHDGRYLASAGEDKVIHIWEVKEFNVMAMRSGDDSGSSGVHAMAMVAGSDGRPVLPDATQEKKKGKKKKGIPNYVHVPENVFGLSETPFCTLEGHTDEVLDLSWSRSRLLISSSMDKTVRLWDIETKNCLKIFSHTDYVTCVQFNPENGDYFISVSLDAKVRIWNIQDGHVVSWIGVHEMVTAVGYSYDGKVLAVGSNKEICRFYNIVGCKLEFKGQVELKTKKKPQSKKITGFQFSTCNPSEVLVTSADSRVRILDGTKLVKKFKGYKNNNSQLSAAYSPNCKYIISTSEDSQVYIWRHEETKGKHKYPIITSYEHFTFKEVSVAAPWPGSSKLQQPLITMNSKRHSKRSFTTMPPTTIASSPTLDEIGHSKPSSTPLPPLPKKSNPSTSNIDEGTEHLANTDSSVGPCESFSLAIGSSGMLDENEMTSSSPSSGPSPGSGDNHGHKTIQATAWDW